MRSNRMKKFKKQKKVIRSILLIIIGLVAVFFLWKQPFRVVADEYQGKVDTAALMDMDAIGALKELEAIGGTPKSRELDILMALGKRKDAIGYLANLSLGQYAAGEGKDASQYYEQALALYSTREIKLRLAGEILAQGRREAAEEHYVALLPDHEALKALEDMGVASQQIAGYLKDKGLWKALLNYIEEAEKLNENQWEARDLQKAMALAGLGRYEEALLILEAQQAQGGLDEELSWWYGRALEAQGDEAGAIKQYRALGERGAYRLGLLLEKGEEPIQAAHTFTKSKERNSLWRGARLWDQLGEWEKAVEVYRELTQTPGNYQKDAAYRAYILLNRNGQAEKAEEMVALLKDQPAWMMRLGREAEWPLEEVVEDDHSGIVAKIEAYHRIGREDLAAIELAIAEGHGDYQTKLSIGEWFLAQNNYSEAVKWGIRALRDTPGKGAYYLTYQRPYEDLVLGAAQEFQVDPYLIWAIMREESHYHAQANSWVGARGLMQIMPATGQEIAGRLGVTVKDEDLLKPEINIRFGTYYISRMINMFSGDLDKALAAYNGGQGNVRKWEKSDLGTHPQDFPTAITFLETQQYITKVLNSYYTYLWLYQ